MATPRSAPPDSAHIALQLRLRQVELSGQILSNACSVHWRVASNPGAWLSSVNAPISDALTVVPESPLLGSYYVGNVPTCFWRAGMGFYGLPPFPKERGARSRGLPGSPMGAPALRSSIPFVLDLESRTCLRLAAYRSATTTTGSGAPFGEDRYPVTVFLALTLLTTISNNMGFLPL